MFEFQLLFESTMAISPLFAGFVLAGLISSTLLIYQFFTPAHLKVSTADNGKGWWGEPNAEVSPKIPFLIHCSSKMVWIDLRLLP
jgi:hypothetical protein